MLHTMATPSAGAAPVPGADAGVPTDAAAAAAAAVGHFQRETRESLLAAEFHGGRGGKPQREGVKAHAKSRASKYCWHAQGAYVKYCWHAQGAYVKCGLAPRTVPNRG